MSTEKKNRPTTMKTLNGCEHFFFISGTATKQEKKEKQNDGIENDKF